MNLYKRPLFMQQGGMARVPVPTPPATMRPAAAPQGAMPPMRPARAPMGPMGLPRTPAAAPAARPTDQAAGIASMVSDKAKADLDQAQGPEQIINAFRGNQKPIQARYQELAEYVGPQDATATPISVLTMVQPSLMMTAKGASESGIGELMAGIAGRVPMESAPGAPNRMGQGLGNIMMSRQAPQPAGMAQGGVVGKFAEGGSSLKDYYDEDLATFQEIMAPTQADRDASKRQLFFDIAQRGLAMAGGAGGTGNVASQLANVFQTLPGTYAAQQAELRKGEQGARNAALQSAAGRVGADREQEAKIAAKRAEMEEEYRLKGLEMNQKFIYDMTVEEAKARNNGLQFEGVIAVDSKGNPISDGGIFNMRDPKDVLRMRAFQGGRQDITFAKLPDLSDLVPSTDVFEGLAVVNSDGTQLGILNAKSPTFNEDLANLREANPNAQVVKIPDLGDLFGAGTSPDIKRVKKSDGNVETFNISNPSQAAAYTTAMRDGGQEVDIEVPDVEVPELTPSQLEGVFTDRGLLEKLSSGNATPQELTRLNAAIAVKTSPKTVGTGDYGPGGIEIMRQVAGERLPEEWNNAIQKAIAAGVNVQLPDYLGQPQPGAGERGVNPLFADYDAQVGTGQPLSLTEIQNAALPDLSDQPSGIESAVMEYPLEKVFGTWASLDRTWNTLGPAVLGLLGPQAAAAAAPEQAEANAEQGLEAFHTLVVESMLAARPGRASNESRQVLRNLLPNINQARSNRADALGKYQALEGEMTTDLRRVEGFLQQPLSQADRQKYDFIRRELTDRLGELSTIVTQLRGSTPGREGTPSSSFDDIFRETTRVPYVPGR